MTFSQARGATLALLFVIAFGGVAHAQTTPSDDPARLAAARDVVNTIGGISEVRRSLKPFQEALIQKLSGEMPAQAAEIATFLQKEMALESTRVVALLTTLQTANEAFYAENFTVEELQAIVVFLKSSAGQKFQGLSPNLAAIIGSQLGAFQEKLIKDVKALAEGKAP